MKLGSIRTDLNASEEGVTFNLNSEGAKAVIAQWGNKSHHAFLRELHKTHGKKIQFGALTDEESEYLLSGQWPHILKKLIGFTEDDGKTPLVTSPQMIIDLARNPQYKDFFKQIETISKEVENFRTETIKALGKPLENSSNGQSDGQEMENSH